VQQQIQNKLDDERGLKGSTVLATATDTGVILEGQVANQNQHDLALGIAKADAGTRKNAVDPPRETVTNENKITTTNKAGMPTMASVESGQFDTKAEVNNATYATNLKRRRFWRVRRVNIATS
jgi:hypothetical protein